MAPHTSSAQHCNCQHSRRPARHDDDDDDAGTFDLLVYTDAEAEVPKTWEESDPKYISKSTEVRLRSFTTKVRLRTSLFPSPLEHTPCPLHFVSHHTHTRPDCQVHKVDAMVAYKAEDDDV